MIIFKLVWCISINGMTNASLTFVFADVLLEKGEIQAEEIWDVYNKAPRIPQVVETCVA